MRTAETTEHAAQALGATDIFAGATHANDRSAALLERLGFEPVAEFENHTRFRLTPHPNGQPKKQT